MINKNVLPLLVTKSIYIFPSFSSAIPIGQLRSIATVVASDKDFKGQLLLVSEKEVDKNKVLLNNFFAVGVLCKLKIEKKLKDGLLVNLQALERVQTSNVSEKNGVFYAQFQVLKDEKLKKQEKEELANLMVKILKATKPNIQKLESAQFLKGDSISEFFNLILHNYPENKDNFKQKALEMNNLLERYKLISQYIKFEPLKNLDFSKLVDQSINRRVKDRLSNQQREFYLREKMKAIREELGEVDPRISEISHYLKRLEDEPFPAHIKVRLEEEIERFQTLPPASGEAGLIKGYIDWLISLPWYQESKEIKSLENSKKILDANHFGLKKAKERIIEHLAANLFAKKQTGQIICLVGPPGVGKTSLGFSIAQAMNKSYVRIALGGVKDEAEIRGHRRTYLGSMPGKIIQALKKAKSINPVVVIDEIDKLSSDFRGDPASAMLEVLDPEQNKEFVDHYIEEPYDLSKVMFIATANYEGAIPSTLHDRMEIVHLSSYTEIEKIVIAKTHLVPTVIKNLGLNKKQVVFENSVLKEIIKFYTRESGVRELKRLITKICRKIIVNILSKPTFQATLTDKNVYKFLNKRIFEFTEKNKKSEIGVVTGLAYTQFGGDILPIETTMFNGQGKLILTGKLGEVMRESANIAYDYIKSNALVFGIDFNYFLKNDFHIHVPEGAIPKDGPSAGVTITTALISLLKKAKVSNDLAMTGEITLRGKVLPIGGLREKTISATRSGIKKIFIPRGNKKDISELPSEVQKGLEIILVENYQEIYNAIFVKKN